MRFIAFACAILLSSPAAAQEAVGVLVNPVTGYIAKIIVLGDAKVRESDLQACGYGCEFTDFLQRGECMIVSMSISDGAFGYHFGPSDDLANSRNQARRHCARYGGKACRESRAICN